MSFFTSTSIFPVLVVAILALLSARLMVRNTSAVDSHEFASIDGLRGFLALLVFIHHSSFWLSYAHSKSWSGNASALYINFGQASICLFFMLSGFLFGHKLLEGRNKEIDWLRLFCSRVMRLTPLYLSLVFLILVIITIESHFVQFEDTGSLRSNVIDWILFTIPGHPNINLHPDTHLMVAGVVWTLPYEWYFYFCLPLLGLLVGAKSKTNSGIWLILSCMCILTFNKWSLDSTLLYGFVGGGFAAYAVRAPWLRELFQGRGANWVLLAGLLVSYTVFNNGTYLTRLLILTVCITLIAAGANLFGLLSCRAARALSTVSYGVYLLHGIVLYVVITYLIAPHVRANLTDFQHWLIIFFCTPIVIGLSTVSWYLIEWPAIQKSSKLAHFLQYLHTSKELRSEPYSKDSLGYSSKAESEKISDNANKIAIAQAKDNA